MSTSFSGILPRHRPSYQPINRPRNRSNRLCILPASVNESEPKMHDGGVTSFPCPDGSGTHSSNKRQTLCNDAFWFTNGNGINAEKRNVEGDAYDSYQEFVAPGARKNRARADMEIQMRRVISGSRNVIMNIREIGPILNATRKPDTNKNSCAITISHKNKTKDKRQRTVFTPTLEEEPSSPITMDSPRSKSRNIPVKKSRFTDDMSSTPTDLSCNERMYDSATWRMYHRITMARRSSSLLNPPSETRTFTSKQSNLRGLGYYENNAGFPSKRHFDEPNHHEPSYDSDASQYGNVFDLDI